MPGRKENFLRGKTRERVTVKCFSKHEEKKNPPAVVCLSLFDAYLIVRSNRKFSYFYLSIRSDVRQQPFLDRTDIQDESIGNRLLISMKKNVARAAPHASQWKR